MFQEKQKTLKHALFTEVLNLISLKAEHPSQWGGRPAPLALPLRFDSIVGFSVSETGEQKHKLGGRKRLCCTAARHTQFKLTVMKHYQLEFIRVLPGWTFSSLVKDDSSEQLCEEDEAKWFVLGGSLSCQAQLDRKLCLRGCHYPIMCPAGLWEATTLSSHYYSD